MSRFQPVKFWIWISSFATLAGWTLSTFGQLNRASYAVFSGIVVVVVLSLRKNFEPVPDKKNSRGKKLLRRFRRLLPFSFAAVAILIFASGVIHAPDNYTGLTYRTARVLQWLSHGHWFWIHTGNYRMNDRACGIEWLSAPILLFTHSTRPLFLLNFLPFLLLPGLIFSVFTQLGVRPRVAWQWMWLLPTGHIFLLQAGSIANDAFPTIYALAAMDFSLRARKSKRISDLWHSILAAALLTGAKGSNLPLLLPWAFLVFPLMPLLRKRMIATATIILLAALISFLPTAILNAHFCGDWSGAKLEPSVMTVKNPLAAVSGNIFQLLLQNFTPPLFPFANWWNLHATEILPRALVAASEKFNNGLFHLGELPTEDWAGLGFGLSVLLIISIAANFLILHAPRSPSAFRLLPSAFLFLPWLALLVYCAKSGMDTAARLIAPYYPLLLPLLLVGAAQSQIVRRHWWRVLVCGNLILAFAVLILTPDRPLWPAKTILSKAAAQHPNSHSLSRALDVYSIYSHRADPLADVRKLLPPNVKTIGFIGDADDCDISLWLPLGQRTVEHFLLDDPPEKIRESKIEYVVIGGYNLKSQNVSLDDWLQKSGAELVSSTNATLKVSEGPQPWFLVRFKP